MSMIIKRYLRFAAGAALALAVWGGVLLALPFAGQPGRQVAVIADPDVIVAAGGRLVDVRGNVVLARSDEPGFAAALYRHGAKLVIEGRVAGGCFTTKRA